MRKNFAIPAVIATVLLLPALTGCGPKGGTITLANESTYVLGSPYISMGEGREEKLSPGQSMRSFHDKNIAGASVNFSLSDGDSKVIVSGARGRFGTGLLTRNIWTSDLIKVDDGAAIVVTVRNKSQDTN